MARAGGDGSPPESPRTSGTDTEGVIRTMHDAITTRRSRLQAARYDGPLVSVGMPIWNGVPHIQQALDSIVRQSYPNLEIIISDDCSTDDTYAVCDRYAREDPRITLIQQPQNLGMWGNFQYVFDRSQGRYFMWASQDDIWDQDWIRNNLLAFTSGEIVTFASFCTIDQQGKRVHAFPEKTFSDNRFVRSLQVMYSHMTGVLMFGLFDKDLLGQVPGFAQLSRLDLYADNVFLLLVAASGRFRSSRGSVLLKRVPVDGASGVSRGSITPRKIARVLRDTVRYCGYYLGLDLPFGMRVLILLNTIPFFFFLLLTQWRGTVYERRDNAPVS